MAEDEEGMEGNLQFVKKTLIGDEARQALKRGVDIVANVVKATLGPRGRLVVLDRGVSMGLTPICTKDGVTVANHVNAVEPEERLGAHLCREASQKTVDCAGDGTTTAAVLLQAMVGHGLRLLAAGANAAAMKRGMDVAAGAIGDQVRKAAIPADGARLHEIAMISSNSDEEVARMVCDAAEKVGKDGVMLIEESSSSRSEITIVDGLQLNMGYDDTSQYFMTNIDSAQGVFADCLVFLYEGTIGTGKQLVNLLRIAADTGRPLLIIAGDYEPVAISTLVKNKIQNNIMCAGIRTGAWGPRRREMLKDIAILTGATPFTEDSGRKIESVTFADLGSCKKVIVSRKTTVLSEGCGQKSALEARIKFIRSQIEASREKDEKAALEARLAGLAGGIAIFRVGADTETAMKEKKDRVDDAMHAVRCAMAEGIVAGGGVALVAAVARASYAVMNDEACGVDIIALACEEPMKQIAENSGISGDAVLAKVKPAAVHGFGFNARTGKYENLIEAGVIDPASVVIEALRNATSIASMILSTEALIAEVEKEE